MKSPGRTRTLSVLFSCAILAVTLYSALTVAWGQNAGGAPESSKRVALVIGNGSYPTSPVGTAVADAKAIAELLKDGGFDVVYAQDARHADLDSAIEQFSRKLERGATAVVYFAGHAIQNQDRNFLMPVDATIASDADLRSNTVDVDLILDPLIVARPRGSVVILDAARQNPWQQKVSARGKRSRQCESDRGHHPGLPCRTRANRRGPKGPRGLVCERVHQGCESSGSNVQGGISSDPRSGSEGKPQQGGALGNITQYCGFCRDAARRTG